MDSKYKLGQELWIRLEELNKVVLAKIVQIEVHGIKSNFFGERDFCHIFYMLDIKDLLPKDRKPVTYDSIRIFMEPFLENIVVTRKLKYQVGDHLHIHSDKFGNDLEATVVEIEILNQPSTSRREQILYHIKPDHAGGMLILDESVLYLFNITKVNK